jgi:hypothetical protein
VRYFFNTANGSFHADPEGTEYPSSDAARKAATQYAGEILKDNPNEIWESNELIVTTTDNTGLILFTILVLAQRSAATRAGR